MHKCVEVAMNSQMRSQPDVSPHWKGMLGRYSTCASQTRIAQERELRYWRPTIRVGTTIAAKREQIVPGVRRIPLQHRGHADCGK